MILPNGKEETNARGRGFSYVAGVDEAGAGALAGPVVAAAVILPVDHGLKVRDSKTLSAKQRDKLFDEIGEVAVEVGIGIVDATLIDEIGIRPSNHLAMRIAVEKLKLVDHALVDGWLIPKLTLSQTRIIRGDQKEFCIAAASIVAKVTRDRIMIEADIEYPQYSFAKHKGYGTVLHREAVKSHGRSPVHRVTFKVR
jgi:ribonuclease HII